MTATLTFDLPTEREEFQLAQKGGLYLSCLYEIAEKLKRLEEYGKPEETTLEAIRKTFWTILSEAGVDPYDG